MKVGARKDRRARPLRHDRKRSTSRTLCGRSVFDVFTCRPNYKYPKNKSNCLACSAVYYANLRRAFNDFWVRWQKNPTTERPSDEEFRREGYR